MLVCTLAADVGTGGDLLAATIAERADARLWDRDALVALARAVEPGVPELDDIEERIGSRLSNFALGVALSTGVPAAVHELGLKKTIAGLGRTVLARAARERAVIASPGAFAALHDHPCAVHVRLRAPFEWRVEAVHRAMLVGQREAVRAVKHDDHVKHAWVKALYQLELDDPANFSLVVDASRLSTDRIADAVLAAAGANVAPVAT